MSLYSKNRFSNLSPERAVNIKTLTESSILEVSNSDNESEDIIESSYFNEVEYDNNAMDPMAAILKLEEDSRELTIESTEDIFKTMMNKIMVLSEATIDSKKYNLKISRSTSSRAAIIKKYGKRLHTKFSSLLIKDKKKNDLYLNAIGKVDASGYPGINSLTFPNRSIVKSVETITDINKLVQFTNRAVQGILKETNPKEIQGYIEELRISIESMNDDDLQIQTKALSRNGHWQPKSQDIVILKDYANGRSLLNSITQCTGKMEKNIDKVTSLCNNAINTLVNNQDQSLSIQKINAIGKCAAAFSGFALLKYNNYSDSMIRIIAAYRKALNSYGKYCLKLSEGKSVNESVEDIVMEEASELYIFELLK